MRSDFSNCKKYLYFEEVQKKLHLLLSIGIFIATYGLIFTDIKEYIYLLAIFLIGFISNIGWKVFFIKPFLNLNKKG